VDGRAGGVVAFEGSAIVNLRKKLIVCIPLTKCDTSIALNSLQQSIKSHIRDLCSDLPALIHLRASKVELQHKSSSTGLWLEVYLEEIPQMTLPFAVGKSERSVVLDIFLQDVALVQTQQREIRHKILKAISPAVNPSENSDVQNIRKRIQKVRRQDEFLIPSGLDPEHLSHDKLPKVMPRGLSAIARVRVNCLSSKKAVVTVRKLLDYREDSGFIGLLPNTKIDLLRLGTHRRPQTGHHLQQAMDTHQDLTVRVTVALNWASGNPQHLELVAIMDDVQDKTTVTSNAPLLSVGSSN
jgi:hypothetical protein